jgi:hypothetical protein
MAQKQVVVQIVQVEGRAQVQWRAERGESGRWIAICQPMNLVTEADSLDELHSVINESMQLLLVDLLKDNELEAFLREHGWHARVPATVDPSAVQFNVPWQLVAEGSNDSTRRAH